MSITDSGMLRAAVRWGFVLVWHLLAALILIQITGIVVGLPVWLLGEEKQIEAGLVLLAYAASFTVPSAFMVAGAQAPRFSVALFTVVVFLPLTYIAPLAGLSVSPALLFATGMLALGLNLTLAAMPGPRLKPLGALLLTGVLLTVVALPPVRGAWPGRIVYHGLRHAESRILNSAYYAINYRLYRARIPDSRSIGGALALLDGHLLLMTGDGHFYQLILSGDAEELSVRPLTIEVPVNISEFQQLPIGPERRKRLSALELLPMALPVEGSDRKWARLLVSHYFWHAEEMCLALRVSSLEASVDDLLAGDAENQWQVVYETEPCLPVNKGNKYRFHGSQAGGRMIRKDADHILLTVGDQGYNGVNVDAIFAQDSDNAYGKIIEIDIRDGSHSVFSSGHRNPQGLQMDRQGRLWSTEQGPRGGDELNLIEPGQNYGWPLETLGTNYGSLEWPLAVPDIHPQFKAPAFSWVPSVAIADLVRLEGPMFKRWQGDLMAASLESRSLYRIGIDQARPIVIEPITVGERVRDIVVDPLGRLIIWTDSGAIGLLSDAKGESVTH